jgi:hypothetical protein
LLGVLTVRGKQEVPDFTKTLVIISAPSYSNGADSSFSTHPVLQFPWPFTPAALPGISIRESARPTTRNAMPKMILILAIRSVIKLKYVLIVSFPSHSLLRIK